MLPQQLKGLDEIAGYIGCSRDKLRRLYLDELAEMVIVYRVGRPRGSWLWVAHPHRLDEWIAGKAREGRII